MRQTNPFSRRAITPQLTLLCLAGLVGPAAVGCGGGSAPGEEVPGASIESEGGETVAASSPEPGGDEVGEAVPGDGPARIQFDVRVKGQPVAAEIRLLDGDTVAASGVAGAPIDTVAGDHAMEVRVTDGLVDHPVQRGQLTLLPQADVTETIDLPWAEVQVAVRINGRLDRKATVDVMRDGETVATLTSDAPHVLITPGRYDAVVKARGATMKVPAVQFPAEAKLTVPVRVKM